MVEFQEFYNLKCLEGKRYFKQESYILDKKVLEFEMLKF